MRRAPRRTLRTGIADGIEHVADLGDGLVAGGAGGGCRRRDRRHPRERADQVGALAARLENLGKARAEVREEPHGSARRP